LRKNLLIIFSLLKADKPFSSQKGVAMKNKTNYNIFLEYMPTFSIWYNALLLYFFFIIVFILVMIFFWLVSSTIWIGAILGQSIISAVLSIYFIYMAKNGDKIRQTYREKYGNLAIQKYWFHYQFATMPFISAAYYFPLLLYNYDFLPKITKLPSNLINNSIFPYFVSIPLGILIVIFGLMMKRPSGGYGSDYDNYIYTIIPEKSRLITEGMYRFIRNPQYLSRGIIAIGFGVIANNISAILVGVIHFISYCAIIPAEDDELLRRYGNEFKVYKNHVPALLPKCGDWKKLLKNVFSK